MAQLTLTVPDAHAARIIAAVEYTTGSPADAEAVRQLLIRYLKDYTLWGERQMALDAIGITEIEPT